MGFALCAQLLSIWCSKFLTVASPSQSCLCFTAFLFVFLNAPQSSVLCGLGAKPRTLLSPSFLLLLKCVFLLLIFSFPIFFQHWEKHFNGVLKTRRTWIWSPLWKLLGRSMGGSGKRWTVGRDNYHYRSLKTAHVEASSYIHVFGCKQSWKGLNGVAFQCYNVGAGKANRP